MPQVFRDIVVDLQVKNRHFTLRKVAASAEGGKLNASGSARTGQGLAHHRQRKVNASPCVGGSVGLWLDTDIDISGGQRRHPAQQGQGSPDR